jgi:hypothetical protein
MNLFLQPYDNDRTPFSHIIIKSTTKNKTLYDIIAKDCDIVVYFVSRITHHITPLRNEMCKSLKVLRNS